MFLMCHEIKIGGVKFDCINSVQITKNVTKLSDTATIVLPAVSHGKELKYVENIKKWQPVRIRLGYDGKLETEFEGFVKSVSVEENSCFVDCEDSLLLFQRVMMPNKELKNCDLKAVLNETINVCNKYFKQNGIDLMLSVDCAYNYGYDKFVFKDCTAYKVFELIQKEGQPNIYIKNNVVYIQPQYTNHDGETTYSLQTNIQKDGLNLAWRNKEDRNLRVKVSAIKKDGTKIEAFAGTEGDDTFNIELKTIRTQDDLQRIADNIYNGKSYSGYEGSFNGWLVPFCDANYIINLNDTSNVLRNGKYYVVGVEVEYSESGGVRKVQLGAKV